MDEMGQEIWDFYGVSLVDRTEMSRVCRNSCLTPREIAAGKPLVYTTTKDLENAGRRLGQEQATEG